MINMKIHVKATLKDLQENTAQEVEKQGFDADSLLCDTDFYDNLIARLERAGVKLIDGEDNNWTLEIKFNLHSACTKFALVEDSFEALSNNCRECIKENKRCMIP